jgi:hypothetical protein
MADLDEFSRHFEVFGLDGPESAWSSYMLERLIARCLSGTGPTVTPIFRGFDRALERNATPLTETAVNLIRDVVRLTRAAHRAAFEGAEWQWIEAELQNGASPTRCYLFFWLLPPETAAVDSLLIIQRRLNGTPWLEEAQASYSDLLPFPDATPLARGDE